MLEQVVDRRLEVVHTGLPVRNHRAAEQPFFARLVEFLVHGHWLQEPRPRLAEVGVFAGVGETREDLREFGDVVVVVGGDRTTVGTELRRGVDVQLEQADRKKLHDFTGEVLVREDVVFGVRLAVVDVAQVDAHRGVQRDVTEQVAKVAERIA